MDKLLIINKANAIRSKYKEISPPICIEKICNALEVEIRVVDLSALEKKAGRSISGLMYQNKEKNQNVIFVNEKDPPARQKFTIAHELGHKVLHESSEGPNVVISFRGFRSQKEREADIFAAEILMPSDLVREEYTKVPFPTTTYLAKVFAVSEAAMSLKLEELGLTSFA